MKLPYRPRFLNWLYAHLNALFWLPCQLCGRNFGGHEGVERLAGQKVCPMCTEIARACNEEYYASPAWEREKKVMAAISFYGPEEGRRLVESKRADLDIWKGL